LSDVQDEWREKRNAKRREKIKETTHINVPDWYSKLPEEILTKVEPMINKIIEKSELTTEEQTKFVKDLKKLAPEYTYWHYRHLHPLVKESSESDYKEKDYYRAFLESVKRYINLTKAKSKWDLTNGDFDMMSKVFGKGGKMTVTEKYKKPSGGEFDQSTKKDIEEGQKFLSMGMISGGRNPPSHEEITDLRDSNLFNEKDCLDLLSTISHLFRRLDDAKKIEK